MVGIHPPGSLTESSQARELSWSASGARPWAMRLPAAMATTPGVSPTVRNVRRRHAEPGAGAGLQGRRISGLALQTLCPGGSPPPTTMLPASRASGCHLCRSSPRCSRRCRRRSGSPGASLGIVKRTLRRASSEPTLAAGVMLPAGRSARRCSCAGRGARRGGQVGAALPAGDQRSGRQVAARDRREPDSLATPGRLTANPASGRNEKAAEGICPERLCHGWRAGSLARDPGKAHRGAAWHQAKAGRTAMYCFTSQVLCA